MEEHSGKQFESCIKFTSTTTLPFEIEINSLHLNQPTIQRVISTQHQPTNQPTTSFNLHFNGVPTPTIHLGINTPNVLPTSSFCTNSEARKSNGSVSFGAACIFIFGWVSYSYLSIYIFLLFLLFLYISYIELRSSKTDMSE